MGGWISHTPSHTVTQAVVVALLIGGVVFRRGGRRLLEATALLRVGGRRLIEIVQAAANAGKALTIAIAVGHLRVRVKASAAMTVVVLTLAALGIHLAVLPAAFKGHLVHLAALIPHVGTVLLAVGIGIRITAHVVHVGIDATGQQSGGGEHGKVFHASHRIGAAIPAQGSLCQPRKCPPLWHPHP